MNFHIYKGVCFIPCAIIVLEQIKTQLSPYLAPNFKTGLFFSAFDQNGRLLSSNGVIKTDRPRETLLQNFYQGILKKQESLIKTIVFDVIQDMRLQNDPNALVKLSLQERGLFLVQGDGQNSGVLLPDTK